MKQSNNLKNILAPLGYKTTTVRESIYTTLLETHKPLSSTELISSIDDIDKVSVYRTIALFESLAIVHRIWNGFKSKIELTDKYSPHHHHFTCLSCQSVSSFKDAATEDALNALASKLDVKITRHLIELTGYCKKCSKDA